MSLITRFEELVRENFKLQQEMTELSRRLMDQDEYVQQVKQEREVALDDLATAERKREVALNDLSDKVHEVNQAQQRTRQAQQAEREAKDELARLKYELEKQNAIPESKWDELADLLVRNEPDIAIDNNNYITFTRKIPVIKEFRIKTFNFDHSITNRIGYDEEPELFEDFFDD